MVLLEGLPVTEGAVQPEALKVLLKGSVNGVISFTVQLARVKIAVRSCAGVPDVIVQL